MIEITCGRDVDRLMLEDPAEYERLLQSFFIMLGDNRVWWKRCAEADDKRWPSCVRDSLKRLAAWLRVDPKDVALVLDQVPQFATTRMLVLRLSREALHDCA